MQAGALYGVLIGLAIAVARVLGPVGWFFFWAVVSCQCGIGTPLVWRRTALPMMTAGWAIAACVSAVFAFVAASGVAWEDLLFRHPVLVVVGAASPALLMFAERWAHPEAWRSLKRQSERSTVRDILRFRHIPDLRHRRHRCPKSHHS
jgi:hypothetical protein